MPTRDRSEYMGLESRRRLVVFPSTSSSSEVARTAGSRICKRPQACCSGKRIASNVRMLVVPGSQRVKREAEAEGLAKIFVDAGAEWRESGCSMCIGMNGDQVAAGRYSVSTSNRNFEGRQGAGRERCLPVR